MKKLVCINSDSNQEAIRNQYQLGSDGGATMESTYLLVLTVRNIQYWMYLVNESKRIAKFFDIGFACDGYM